MCRQTPEHLIMVHYITTKMRMYTGHHRGTEKRYLIQCRGEWLIKSNAAEKARQLIEKCLWDFAIWRSLSIIPKECYRSSWSGLSTEKVETIHEDILLKTWI